MPMRRALGYEHFDHNNGIAGDDTYRLCVADVEYGGARHLFGLMVEAHDAEDLAARMAVIEPSSIRWWWARHPLADPLRPRGDRRPTDIEAGDTA